jgi:hypothetical protein
VRVLTELDTALAERGFTALTDAVGYAHLDEYQRVARRKLAPVPT